MRKITIIVAVAKNGIIGREGKIPWSLSSDLKRFRKLTEGKTVIMGRKTWESLPIKPLPHRQNIVLSRDPNLRIEGVSVASNFKSALRLSKNQEVFVIGGRDVFLEAMRQASRLLVTEVDSTPDGDACFEEILHPDPKDWWLVSKSVEKEQTGNNLTSAFLWYERIYPLT